MDIELLILHSVYGCLSEDESRDLSQWLEKEGNKKLYEKICYNLKNQDAVEFLSGIDTEAALRRTKRKRHRPVAIIASAITGLAAAILIGVSLWPGINEKPTIPEPFKCATLTFASGEILPLDGTSDNHHAEEDVRIEVSGETIQVLAGKSKAKKTVYNTLNVPHGESYSIMLTDGTRIWVNALSELKFPSSFEGSTERVVELSGEGYFEVARDTAHPFRVVTPRQTIVVTGTEFNVTAYAGQTDRTTLCSGSVTVGTATGKTIHLTPGQQLSLDSSGEPTVTEVNSYIYTAWRTGEYYFDNQTLGEVFLTLGRWFDIREVMFTDITVEQQVFCGKLKKSDGLETILQVIGHGSGKRIDYTDGKIEIGTK